ncbi:hypothetical protein D3C81_384440 [compost metagenome]
MKKPSEKIINFFESLAKQYEKKHGNLNHNYGRQAYNSGSKIKYTKNFIIQVRRGIENEEVSMSDMIEYINHMKICLKEHDVIF